jgi:tetratricopeptide (TPR) repeat protein
MAKRLNKRFLIILTSIVGLMLVGSVVVGFLLRKNAGSYVKDGDAAMARGDYKAARDAYGLANGREAANVQYLTKLGDACDALAAKDPENLMEARRAWNAAVTVDPKYVPALRRLANSYWDQVEGSPNSPELYRLVRESHARLLDALPADAPKAERAAVESRMHLGTLLPWTRMNAPLNEKDVGNAVAALARLAPLDPTNFEVPSAVEMAYVKWANEANDAGKEAEKLKLVGQAQAQAQASLKGQEQNAGMQLSVFTLNTAIQPLLKDDAARKAARAAADAALAAALAAAKPDDLAYTDVMIQAAAKAQQDGQPKEAEKLYQELLAKRPDDPRARFVVAKAMARDKTKRDQAMALFAKPVTSSGGGGGGAKALRNREWEIRMLLELVGLRIDLWQEAQGEAARAEVAKAIDQDFQQLQTVFPADAVPVLRLKARYQRLQGDVTGAVQLYAKAVELSGTPDSIEDFDLMSELAQAYLSARPPQAGAAQKLLDSIARRIPQHVPTRLQLANLALNENDLEDAKRHAADLEKYAPTNPQVINLRAAIVLRESGGDPAKVDAFVRSLPEKTREERIVKAEIVGATLGRLGESTRLLRANVAADPKDLQSTEGLMRSLLAEKKNDEARQVVADAIRANPGNAQWKKAGEELDRALQQQKLSPAEQYDSAVARVKDELKEKPAALAATLGDLARRYGKTEEAEKQYRAAERVEPANLAVTARLYELLMERQRYADAKPYLEKLAKANADGREGLALGTKYALATGDAAGATEQAKKLTARWPEFGESWLLLGQAQQADGKPAEALTQYAAARQRQGKNAEAIKGIIECYYATGRPAEARAAILEGRALFPNEGLFRELELSYEANFGDVEKTIPAREQAVKAAPDELPPVLALVEAYGRAALVKYGNDPAKRKQFLEKAKASMTEAVRRWPDEPRAAGGLSDVLLALGEADAGEKVLAAFAATPGNKDKHLPQLMLASYYTRCGKPDQAVASMRQALASSKGDKQVRRQLVAMMAQQGKYDDALRELDDAPPGDPIFVRQRVEVLINAGRKDEAEQAIRKAMAEMPQVRELGILLATLYIDSGRFDEAAAEVDKALAKDPNDVAALYYRAAVKLRRTQNRDVAGAVSDLQKVRQIEPNNVPSRVLMADAYTASGSRQKALVELEDALRLAPLNTDVRRRLIDAYAGQGQHDDVLRLTAAAEATPGIDTDPTWPLAASRALAAQSPPDYTAALAALKRAVGRAPKNNGELVREMLGLLHKAGNDKELLRVSDELLAGGTKEWWVYQMRGVAKTAARDAAGAAAEFDLALAEADRKQDDRAAQSIVESLASSLGADRALQRATARSANDLRWKAVAATLYQLKGDWAGATGEADGLVALVSAPPAAGAAPPDARQKVAALRTAASVYHFAPGQPQLEKAKSAYLRLLELQPGDYFALNNLAVLLAEDTSPPNLPEARKYSEKAYDLVRRAQPMVTHVVDTYGWILTLNGEVDEAIPLLKSVVDNDPFAEARYHLGEAYLRKNRGPDAREQFAAAQAELKAAQSKGQPTDAKLLRKIEDALNRARTVQSEAQAQ